MAKHIIGVDPGTHGAFTVVDIDGVVQYSELFPTYKVTKKNTRKPRKNQKTVSPTRIETFIDFYGMRQQMVTIKNSFPDIVGYIEKVGAMPHDGSVASFKFGTNFGAVCMALDSVQIPYLLVAPLRWQRAIHNPVEFIVGVKPKKRSDNAMRRIFHMDGKIHDGIADSTLIAVYGQRNIISGQDMLEFNNLRLKYEK